MVVVCAYYKVLASTHLRLPGQLRAVQESLCSKEGIIQRFGLNDLSGLPNIFPTLLVILHFACAVKRSNAPLSLMAC